VITNPIGEPVLLLNIEHAKVQQLKLLDETVLITLAMLATLPLLMLLFVDRYLLAPVIYAARYIRRMTKSQQYKPILSKYSITEIKALRDDFNELINTINNQQRALEDMALKDGLTNIGNRRSFELFIADSWSRMQRNQHPIAVLMCDIDYFKPFNDNYGHQAGDQALVAVASALDNKINRVSDLVARYGGEEFVLVLADSSKENYEYVVNIVLEAVRQLKIPHHHSKNSQYLTISIGAALVSDIQDVPLSVGFDQLVKAADDALYQAKNDGRDRAVMVDFIASNNEVKFYRNLN
jgi:diguanylate cyclase (GGDEF)-like protein